MTEPATVREPLNGNDARPVVGVDIGGSKIAVLVVDADGASSVPPRAASVADQDGAADVIAAVVDERPRRRRAQPTTSPPSASASPAGSTR